MKSLLLIRHAKSSWKFPQLEDHDRPLNKRGERDIVLMASYLREQNLQVEKIVSSSATRALKYANHLSEHCCVPLSIEQGLYTFSASKLMLELCKLESKLDTVAVVAHNPAITGLVNELGKSYVDNVLTSAIAYLRLSISEWADIKPACGELLWMQTPKALLV